MDTLAAVQAAKSVGNAASADGAEPARRPHPAAISAARPVPSTASRSQVTNVGTGTQIVHAHARALTAQLSNQTGTVTLNSGSPTFVDQFGTARPYQTGSRSTCPRGADRLVAFDSWTGRAPASE